MCIRLIYGTVIHVLTAKSTDGSITYVIQIPWYIESGGSILGSEVSTWRLDEYVTVNI